MKVKGVAAIVTGGGSGLGEGTARALAKAGAKVAILDINFEQAEKVAKEIGGIALACDVSSGAAGEAAIEAAAKAHGEARILINCAGIANAGRVVGREGPHDLELFQRVINVNLVGSFNMLRLVAERASKLEALEDNERAIIISTASVAAFDGQIGQSAYAASKGAIHAMALPIARETAKFGIRIMTIAPGIFGTPMVKGMTQEVQDSLAASIPYPSRLGTPEEYASLAMHIIDNTMLNGETIRLDGAIRMPPK